MCFWVLDAVCAIIAVVGSQQVLLFDALHLQNDWSGKGAQTVLFSSDVVRCNAIYTVSLFQFLFTIDKNELIFVAIVFDC